MGLEQELLENSLDYQGTKEVLKENMRTMLVDTREKVSEVDDNYVLCHAGVVYWENGTY